MVIKKAEIQREIQPKWNLILAERSCLRALGIVFQQPVVKKKRHERPKNQRRETKDHLRSKDLTSEMDIRVICLSHCCVLCLVKISGLLK